jgi:hypothetical protein
MTQPGSSLDDLTTMEQQPTVADVPRLIAS